MKKVNLIVAYTHITRAIGSGGKLPWGHNYKEDRVHFRKTTWNSTVIMGRKTYESIGKPLDYRRNIVISKGDDIPGVTVYSDLLLAINESTNYGPIFIIGGNSLYTEMIEKYPYLIDKMYITIIPEEYPNCDTYFPYTDNFEMISMDTCKSGMKFLTMVPKTIIHEEYQYLHLLQKVIDTGVYKQDRTGVGTLSIFGASMKFNLRNNSFPLITTKKTYWKGIVEELLWFIKGSTNAKELTDKGVRIWEANGSREYLDSIGLHDRETNDLGPIYGFQWRHFGEKYTTMHEKYTGGIDQLAKLIKDIKENPNSRRHIMSAWNPVDLDKMALPPCHVLTQFYVNNGELSCQMYQRSADMGLGVPFNIASYSLLTCIIAKCCGLVPGDFIHIIGDCHIYSNHINAIKEQLVRKPYPFPKLMISKKDNIDNYEFNDFELIDYKSGDILKMDMSI